MDEQLPIHARRHFLVLTSSIHLGFARARLRPLAVAAVLTVFAAGAPALHAQQTDTATTDNVPLYHLEGITVTVSRSREDINRLPYAVSLVSAPQIHGLDPAISLQESLAEIPGVLVDDRYNFALGNRISIRGFGARSQFGVRGVRIIQDGIPLTLPDGQAQLNNVDLAAAGRIEVIRGPAASLYGNASAGVISIRTAAPPDAPFRPSLRIVGGGLGNGRAYRKLDATAGGHAASLGYVAHLSHFDTDGFRQHSEAQNTLLNTRLTFDLDDGSQLAAVINFVNAPQAENPSSLNDSLAAANPDTVRDIVLPASECPADPAFGGCQNLGEESHQLQAALTYERRLATEHQASLMVYGLTRELDNRIPFTLIELRRVGGGLRAEYRFAPTAQRLHRLVAGFDLDAQADDRLESARDGTGAGPVSLDQDESVTSLGAFANLAFVLIRDLEANISLRYDRTRFEADDHLVGAGDPDDSGTRSMDQWSPMLGLSWTRSAALNIYANAGRTFQTPTTTELTDTLGGFNADLQPERATHVEMGVKGTVEQRLSYGLALFHAEIEDQLIGFEAAGLQRIFFRNAGSSDHDGIEASLSALLARGITATAAYTLSHFEFADFSSAEGDFAGNRVPGVPPHHFHGRLAWRHATGFSGSVRVTAVDGYYVNNANSERNAGYTTIDLRAGWSGRLPGLQVELFSGLNNLLDRRYNSSVVVNAFGGQFFEPAPGRNSYLGIRLTP